MKMTKEEALAAERRRVEAFQQDLPSAVSQDIVVHEQKGLVSLVKTYQGLQVLGRWMDGDDLVHVLLEAAMKTKGNRTLSGFRTGCGVVITETNPGLCTSPVSCMACMTFVNQTTRVVP